MSRKRINIQEVSHISFLDLIFDNNGRLFFLLSGLNFLIPLSLMAFIVSIANLNIISTIYDNNSIFAIISVLIQIL